jgi:hypothetical protein
VTKIAITYEGGSGFLTKVVNAETGEMFPDVVGIDYHVSIDGPPVLILRRRAGGPMVLRSDLRRRQEAPHHASWTETITHLVIEAELAEEKD